MPFVGKMIHKLKTLGQAKMVGQLEEEDYVLAVAQDLQLLKEFN